MADRDSESEHGGFATGPADATGRRVAAPARHGGARLEAGGHPEQTLLSGREAERQRPLSEDSRGRGRGKQEPPDSLHVRRRRVPRLPRRLHRALRPAGPQQPWNGAGRAQEGA